MFSNKETFFCDCGEDHSLATQKIIFESGAIEKIGEFLSSIAPPLSSVLIISDSIIYEKTNRAFEKKIGRLGYRISSFTFEGSPLASVEVANEIVIPEDCLLIIGIGGGTIADISKYIANKKQLKSVFILTSPNALGVLSPTSVLFDNGIEKQSSVMPFNIVLCDTNFLSSVPSEVLACSYGEIISKAISVFDYKASGVLNDEHFCSDIHLVAYSIIDDTLRSVMSDKDIIKLTENSLKLSSLCQLVKSDKIISGGEVAVASTAHTLMRYEERQARLKGEREILLAKTLASLYQGFLSAKSNFFSPPPDNNKRLECMEEFLGLKQTDTIKLIRRILPIKKSKLAQYMLNEYRDELLLEASLNTARVAKGTKIFKRFYLDDGFSLEGFLDNSTVALSIAFAPDLSDNYLLLSYMKDMGLLDEYLLK
ncbi:MAG: iron-containing alcohol dehydrogenase [Firmicutes bacterium]|nr:iron-containing alcohol dehydrogenase [Bacillota bacterium]